MKIALVSTFFHPVTGGVETHVLSLARELTAKGHEVVVLTSDSNKSGPRIKEKETDYLGVKVKRFRSLFSFSYYHKFYPGLFLYLLRSDLDIVHVHGFRKVETYIAQLASLFKRFKVVLTTHNPFPTSTRRVRFNLLINLHDRTIGRLFTGRLSKIITLVQSEKTIFRDRFKVKSDKLTTIPNAITDTFFEEGDANAFFKDWDINPEKWDAIAVSVGRVNFAKGFQNLELAVKKHPKVLFFIAGGDDGYMDKLKFLYAKSKNVFFTDRFISQEKLNDMYAAADLFVFPSFHEAFGIVILEAMSAGVPVIATNVGGPAELFDEKTAILLDPEDQEAWSREIGMLLEDEKRMGKMRKAEKQLAQNYKWDKIAVRISNVYKKLLKVDADTRTKQKRR
ncbi:MAG: glycosyltransferase family 4 protein [Candidatus Dojkabacteria bacterium]